MSTPTSPHIFDLLPEKCRGLIEIRWPGMQTGGRREDLYRLCPADAKAHQRTAEWVAMTREMMA